MSIPVQHDVEENNVGPIEVTSEVSVIPVQALNEADVPPLAPEAVLTAIPADDFHDIEAATAVMEASEEIPTAVEVSEPIVCCDLEAGVVSSESRSEGLSERKRPEFNSTTLLCKNPTRLGLSTETCNGRIRVKALDPCGILSQSPLRVGDYLLSVNGNCCSETKGHVTDVATKPITIVGHNVGGDPNLVESMAEKASPEARVGISIRSNSRGDLEVSRVAKDGIFAHSLLVSFDSVLINDKQCHCCKLTLRLVLLHPITEPQRPSPFHQLGAMRTSTNQRCYGHCTEIA